MRLAELAARCGARLIGDGDVVVARVGAIDEADRGTVAFIGHAHDRQAARSTQAAAVIADDDFGAEHAHELPCAVLVASAPARALRLAIEALHPISAPRSHTLRHPSAVIADTAQVADDVVVGAGCVVEEDVVIGAGSVLHPSVVVRRGVRLGARVRVGPGSVLGDDGFVFDEGGVHVAGAAGVVVGDDCFIGATVCIDRGLLRDTRLGARCRVDNLVQIGHDVVLGDDVVIVAQAGLAGHATVGIGASIGGQAGLNPHVRLAPRVRVGGQAGVTNDVVNEGAIVAGTPAFLHHEWLKAMARLRRQDELERRLRALEGMRDSTTATYPPRSSP
jgi:UDP-3-O-[3-hydroxymyristoyl] glucosamine N-acyltransferase